jgi:hypothetical protein
MISNNGKDEYINSINHRLIEDEIIIQRGKYNLKLYISQENVEN